MQLTATTRACAAGRRAIAFALLAATASAPGLLALPQTARAYSSFADYMRPIQEGGGGGRLFTGTPADAHGCDVCHRGAEAAPLEVIGLPSDGYVPGQAYEVLLRWPETAPHVALMAEFTDARGGPAGVTALAPIASWGPSELCADSGFPAADVCRAGPASGCCRDLEPTRDACSFPGERAVFWLLDCGSRSARLIWTAPAEPAGDVWFSSAMVTSNLQNDALGDGATSVRRRLWAAGRSTELITGTGSCQIAAHSTVTPAQLALLTLLPLGFSLRRVVRRRASRTQPNAAPTGHASTAFVSARAAASNPLGDDARLASAQHRQPAE